MYLCARAAMSSALRAPSLRHRRHARATKISVEPSGAVPQRPEPTRAVRQAPLRDAHFSDGQPHGHKTRRHVASLTPGLSPATISIGTVQEKHARRRWAQIFWHCRGRRSEQCRSAWHHFDHGMPLSLRCSPPIINIDLSSSTADGTARAAGSFCLMMLISSAASPVHANSSCVAGQPRTAADAE